MVSQDLMEAPEHLVLRVSLVLLGPREILDLPDKPERVEP